MSDLHGPEEFAVLRPTLKGGIPDRVDSYGNASRNTLAQAEQDRRLWLLRGEDALVVSRQWKVM
jgi:hypothetical protein